MPPRQMPPSYREEVLSGDCFCAVPAAHPLAAEPMVELRALDGVPMGALHSDHASSRQLQSRFAAAGVELNKTVESQFFLPLLHFVAADQCCAIVDPLSVASERLSNVSAGKVVFRPIRGPGARPLRYDYALLSPRYKPLSQLAIRMRDGWKAEVLRLLEDMGANPVVAAG